jgi:hypothetical protein
MYSLFVYFFQRIKNREEFIQIFLMQIFIGLVPGIRAHEHLQVVHTPLFLVSQYAVGSIYFHKLEENGVNEL